jgi:hypothetical protein
MLKIQNMSKLLSSFKSKFWANPLRVSTLSEYPMVENGVSIWRYAVESWRFN